MVSTNPPRRGKEEFLEALHDVLEKPASTTTTDDLEDLVTEHYGPPGYEKAQPSRQYLRFRFPSYHARWEDPALQGELPSEAKRPVMLALRVLVSRIVARHLSVVAFWVSVLSLLLIPGVWGITAVSRVSGEWKEFVFSVGGLIAATLVAISAGLRVYDWKRTTRALEELSIATKRVGEIGDHARAARKAAEKRK